MTTPALFSTYLWFSVKVFVALKTGLAQLMFLAVTNNVHCDKLCMTGSWTVSDVSFCMVCMYFLNDTTVERAFY